MILFRRSVFEVIYLYLNVCLYVYIYIGVYIYPSLPHTYIYTHIYRFMLKCKFFLSIRFFLSCFSILTGMRWSVMSLYLSRHAPERPMLQRVPEAASLLLYPSSK